MAAKVVDASAIAAVVFGEPEGMEVWQRLESSSLWAPPLFPYEIANICWKKVRRFPEQREKLLEAYSLLGRIEIEEVEVLASEAFLLADRENLTVYDASYLWLALKLGVELVTLDGDLNKAASRLSEST